MNHFFQLKAKLVDALLICTIIEDRHTRDTVVRGLPDVIRMKIHRNSANRVDVMNIVSECLGYSNGLEELIDVVRFYEGDSIGMQEVEKIVLHIASVLQEHHQSHSQKHNQISDWLAQARQGQFKLQSETAQQRHKVDKNIIVQFDLESLIAEFHRCSGYEGSFSFAVGGPYVVLEHYIIQRILQELKNKTQNPYKRINISLYQGDVSIGTDVINRKLTVSQDCRQVCDLLADDAPIDIVMVVWNHNIPSKDMSRIATAFWSKANAQVTPLLRKKSRCFVVIWANVGVAPLDAFVMLPVPDPLDTDNLAQWFRGRLRQLALSDDEINRYLARLASHHGDLVGTYQEMNYIVQDLQGGTTHHE
ncbi:MAG: hypothetical protein GY832_35355 [Chloroflexi bacterium]|nr:hypothetical protein [Chloroflexota bacterium]